MTRTQAIKRRALGVAAVVGMAVALGACHGHDDDDDVQAPPVAGTPTPPVTPPVTPPPTATDAFIAAVMQLVGAQDETSEPTATDSVTVTTPDDTEPKPVAGT